MAEANLWPDLDARLREIAIVDPACGSGSFLVGMLHILDDLQARAADQLGKTEASYDRKQRIIGQNLYGVDVMEWAVHKDEWLSQPIANFSGGRIPAGCQVVESWVGRFKKTSKARDPLWPTRGLIEERYLRPVITSPQEAPAIEVDPQSLEYLLLSVYEDWRDLEGTHVREYLEFAKSSRRVTLANGEKIEALQVNKRPELSKRKGDGRRGGWWYSVRDKRYGHLLAPMASSDLFRVNYVREIIPNDHNLFTLES